MAGLGFKDNFVNEHINFYRYRRVDSRLTGYVLLNYFSFVAQLFCLLRSSEASCCGYSVWTGRVEDWGIETAVPHRTAHSGNASFRLAVNNLSHASS